MDISLIIKAAMVAAALSAAAIAHYVFKAKDDNAVEELAEEVIAKQTGISSDLTPSSPEKDVKKDN